MGLRSSRLLPDLSGIDLAGRRSSFRPIRDVAEIYEDLDQRTMAGFGGVAEYGITVRWDKNNLTIIRLLLERRSKFTMYGGVRFGGTLTIDDAFARGFDHSGPADDCRYEERTRAWRPSSFRFSHGIAAYRGG